jgi:hypothetical protein
MSLRRDVGPHIFCSKGCRFSRNEVQHFYSYNVNANYRQRQSFPLKPFKFIPIITLISCPCCFNKSLPHQWSIHWYMTMEQWKWGPAGKYPKLYNGFTMAALYTPMKESRAVNYKRVENRCMFLSLFELCIPSNTLKSSTKRVVIIFDIFTTVEITVQKMNLCER